MYGTENWTLRTVDQKYLESFEMWCCRRLGKISWTKRVRNEVLQVVYKDGNILHTARRRRANCIGHILRRNCLLKHVIELKIEGYKSREDVGEDVRSYWMTLRKREDTRN